MCVFKSAAPRLDTASIENTVAFHFDGTPLLLLSIQVKIDHVWAVAAIHLDLHFMHLCMHWQYYLSVLLLHALNQVIYNPTDS